MAVRVCRAKFPGPSVRTCTLRGVFFLEDGDFFRFIGIKGVWNPQGKKGFRELSLEELRQYAKTPTDRIKLLNGEPRVFPGERSPFDIDDIVEPRIDKLLASNERSHPAMTNQIEWLIVSTRALF